MGIEIQARTRSKTRKTQDYMWLQGVLARSKHHKHKQIIPISWGIHQATSRDKIPKDGAGDDGGAPVRMIFKGWSSSRRGDGNGVGSWRKWK